MQSMPFRELCSIAHTYQDVVESQDLVVAQYFYPYDSEADHFTRALSCKSSFDSVACVVPITSVYYWDSIIDQKLTVKESNLLEILFIVSVVEVGLGATYSSKDDAALIDCVRKKLSEPLSLLRGY